MAFELPPLPYDYSALEPYIDEQTMHLHHDKHHQAYVTNLNNALQGQSQFENLPIEELIRRITAVSRPARSPAPSRPRSARSTTSRRSSTMRASSASAPVGRGW